MNKVSLPKLNFESYDFRLRERGDQLEIFDPVRKKFLLLTPEEWVRQHVVAHLNDKIEIPHHLMEVEKEFKLNELSKRADILIRGRDGNPLFLVECKRPEEPSMKIPACKSLF